VVYPTQEEFSGHQGPYPTEGREGIVELFDFVDFGPLLAWRKSANAKLPEPMTVGAAILWRLASYEPFRGIFMGSTVDCPQKGHLPRGVGLVVTRPLKYLQRPNGLADYARDFNQQMELARTRNTDRWKTLDAAAHLPAGMADLLLRRALAQGGGAFGSFCLSMLKDARVFGAPIGDIGQDDGFLAIGSVMLDAGNGRTVGCIAIKGLANRVAGYPALLRKVIEESGKI
jgi:hypothetical protein